MNDIRPKHKLYTMRGTIVDTGQIQDFQSKKGLTRRSAMIHIQEDLNDPASAQMAIKVSGDLCNYVGCIGARVNVEYVVRVFECTKNGIKTFGNDVYATSINFVR